MTYGFALADNPVREVFFDTEDLVRGFRTARPAVYNDAVASLVLTQLNAVGGAGGANGEMPLFGFDATGLRPKQSLAGALSMMGELTATLSDDAEDGSATLLGEALCAMLRARLAEDREKLEQLCGADGGADGGAACSMRASVEALLSSEVEALEDALERQAEL
eukprot:5663710-Prymnesium_polylepis.1